LLTLRELLGILPQQGRVEWIGLRPARGKPMEVVASVAVGVGSGLRGDRFRGNADSKRQVTLIQFEHLDVVARLLGQERIDPALVRRNIAVSGINLLALQRAKFSIGEVILEGTGPCHPCSRMESALGTGGYNAMRGHGGITARVLRAGTIHVGDAVALVEAGALDAREV
jgi:MOSC domain-containing protein YiiM